MWTSLLLALVTTAHPIPEPRFQEHTAAATAVGEVFQDLRLPTIDGGRVHQLSDLRGRTVLLVDFASW